MNSRIQEIKEIHRQIECRIQDRLRDFSSILQRNDEEEIFMEMVFCLLTPQSSAKQSWRAVNRLKDMNLVFTGNVNDLSGELNIVRFRNNKSKYIVEARKHLSCNCSDSLISMLNSTRCVQSCRRWLVNNIKGLGFKEASHFLRNIGLGKSIAILDRHVLKNMALAGLIEEVPASLTPLLYLDLEQQLSTFASEIAIPLDHLDFVLWYRETGEVFK